VLSLGGFLSAPEVFSLRLCSRACFAVTNAWKVQKLLTGRVRALLSKLLGLDAQGLDQFFATLRRHDGVVSGSSLLCALTGDSWQPRDCNILLPGNLATFYAFEKELRTLFEVCGECSGTAFAANEISMYCSLEIRHKTGRKWRLTLLLTPEPAAQWILEESEFDFLKNTFDGVDLVVHDMQSVRTRTSVRRASCNQAHCRQYTDRGFLIQF
jgi:hypothetical protein